ncbi:tetratricopeptide repeat protein [Kitasatospora sp. NPDC051853]|uniref:tetratricopeptide repeat protein n=1 Tax=Kitasatospora sp. NPDC051853 TaxID=3364058 RepID=UPI00379A37F3
MEFDRRVQIRVRQAGTAARGFLIAPRLVLTADHVLDGMDPSGGPGTVTVRLPDSSERQFPATVRWRRLDGTVDAALLEVDEDADWHVPASLSDLLIRPPQRYGHLIGTRPHPVALTGFPRLQKDPEDGRRLDEQVTGHIVPGTGELAGRYEVSSTTPAPVGPPAKVGSRWSGISGAAVLAEDGHGQDLLCGVVRRDRRAEDGTRLTATPISALLADEAFHALITEHTGWTPILEPAEPVRLLSPATADRDLESPAALLRADAEAVTFHGRDNELADLRTWCDEGPASIAIRILTGPGGQGKTRLARRLTDTLGRQGWAAGHLRPDLTDHDTAPDLASLATQLPLLLVVDYAETRPRLLRQVVGYLYRSRHRVRLLLLARSDGEWRTDALSAAPPVRRLLVTAPVVPLAPLIPHGRPVRDREKAFRQATKDLARLLPRVPSVLAHGWDALAGTVMPPEDLGHSRYDNALTLQLTALVALLQGGPRPVLAATSTPAEEVLLEHEERFWTDSADAPAFRLALPTPILAGAVAVAALCGASTAADATSVLATLPGLPADRIERTVSWLATLYPADPDRFWGSLQPDRIAEYHASRVLARNGVTLPALLTAADPGQQAQTVTVLARAATAHYDSGRAAESEAVLATLDTALDTAPRLSDEAAVVIGAALPHPSRIIAPLAIRLGFALSQTSRQLAEEDPAGHGPDLALVLSNLGVRLGEVGRRGEALAVSEEAVQIYRRLTREAPAVYEPELARSLSNLGARLGEVGRRGEALAVSEQAVEIRSRLVVRDPVEHESELAATLSNLGVWLAEVGRNMDALAVTERAVESYRRLARRDAIAHEPHLAVALSNLGVRLGEVGRRGEALAVSEEAVEIRRRLAWVSPSVHEPELAASLSNLGNHLGELEKHAEALEAELQAVEIRIRLVAESPVTHEPDLARSLSNLAVRYAQLGATGEALTVVGQAVEIYHRLVADNPPAFEPSLAKAKSIRGVLLAVAGDESGALEAVTEAEGLFRSHLEEMPSLVPQFIHLLTLQARMLDVAGRAEEAAAVRRWLAENPLPSSAQG